MMKQEEQIASVLRRIRSAVLAVIGVGYLLMPILAMRPDGMLAYKGGASLWTVVIMHPIVGAAMVYTAIISWRRCTTMLILWFWAFFLLLVAGSPVTVGFLTHYGK
jgi:hypothetical protein